MNRYGRPLRALAACLSGVAGFVDAIAFVALGGFFVSFMSGNTTRLGVGAAELSRHAVTAGGLIACFVAGVALGSALGHATSRRGPSVLALVAGLLAAAALAGAADHLVAAAALMALAMGAENAVFEEEGEIRIGLTYMTGTLVKTGQRLAEALRGGDAIGWLAYLIHWFGLAAGALAGAVAYAWLGLSSLWIAASAMALLALAAIRLEDPGI